MPRNVVAVVRRRWVLTRHRRALQDVVFACLGERYRVRSLDDDAGVKIDFPKRLGKRQARERVVADLDRMAPGWSRVVRIYPTESALCQVRDPGE